MFIRGNYKLKIIFWDGRKEILITNTKKNRNYHTHVSIDRYKAAQMIVIRANQGSIPDTYPKWMIKSINRRWYRKDTEKMDLEFSPNIKRKKKQKYLNKSHR